MLSICSKITGTNEFLTYSGKKWSWQQDPDQYLFGGQGARSIEPLLRIHGIKLEELIEKKWKTMTQELGLERPNFIGLIGPSFRRMLAKRTIEAFEHMQSIKEHKYTGFYYDTNEWLWTLSGAPIDYTRYHSIKAMGHSLSLCHKNGLIEEIRYDRSKIKTGRLSVIQGPQIMTMKAEWRNIAKGCRQIDFSSMEPLFLLNLSGHQVEGDLYEWVAKKANLKGDRTYTKIAIISSMYGSKQVPEVSKLFALDEWCSQLEAHVSDGVIENYYGRPIQCGDTKGRHLLSFWLQSSAADAAIKGFAQFFRNNLQFSPHWIIHDACIFSGEGSVPSEIIIDGMKFPIKCGEV